MRSCGLLGLGTITILASLRAFGKYPIDLAAENISVYCSMMCYCVCLVSGFGFMNVYFIMVLCEMKERMDSA